jgi:hypothetical protein
MWISFSLDSRSITAEHVYLTSFFCFRNVCMLRSNNSTVLQADMAHD